MSQSRRIDRQAVQKLGGFAVVTGAALLVAAFASLVLIGTSSRAVAAAATPMASSTAISTAVTTTAATQAAPTTTCFPLTESSRTCYNVGEFCPNADLNMSGVAANGTPIACESDEGQQPHWEACKPATFSTTPASTAAEPVCPVTPAGTAAGSTTAPASTATAASAPAGASTGGSTSATTAATTGTPAGAPATGGGTGSGTSGTLAAAGCAVMVVGVGLVILSRRRGRRLGPPTRN